MDRQDLIELRLLEFGEVRKPLLERLLEAVPWWQRPELFELALQIKMNRVEAYGNESLSYLVLLETVDWPRARELSIYGMVGLGILKAGDSIMADLKTIAKRKGCQLLGGLGGPKGWKKVCARHGFDLASQHYLMEV